MEQTNAFDHFKKNVSPQILSPKINLFLFQICFDEFGAYLSLVDKKGKPLDVWNTFQSASADPVLKQLYQIMVQSSFIISWDQPNEQVYLKDHPHLMALLKAYSNIVDSQMKRLQFEPQQGQLSVKVSSPSENGIYSCQVLLDQEIPISEMTSFINGQYLIFQQKIIEIPDLGLQYQSILSFNTSFQSENLSLFLSLLYTNFPQVPIQFAPFSFEHLNRPYQMQPCLVFEKIDEDNTLFLRIGKVLPQIDFSLLDQYALTHWAALNEEEKTITVTPISDIGLEESVEEVAGLLKKYLPRKKKNAPYSYAQEGNTFVIPEEMAGDFIYQDLPDLLFKYQLFGAEQLKSYRVSTTIPSIHLNVSHNIDFLEGEVTLDFGEDQFNLFDVLKQYRQNRYVQLSDGTNALLNETYIKKIERLFKKQGKKAQVSFFDLPQIELLIEDKITGGIFQKSKDFYRGFNSLSSKRLKKIPIEAKLRPYQKKGVKWLQHLHEFELGGCLADDMGLGKTIQCIAILAQFYKKKNLPSLIVMPKSLLQNWKREIEKFAPQLSVDFYYGPQRSLDTSMKANVILTTYAIIRNDIEQLQEHRFFYLVLDESQNIKSVNAQTTKAVMLLDGQHRLALSGTPIENNLSELYSLFRFLNPTMFGTMRQFNERYLFPIQKWHDTDAAEQLRKKIYPFVLRRLKKEVLKELPSKMEHTVYVSMSDDQKTYYEERRQFYKSAIDQQIAQQGLQKSRFFVFQAFNELRQIATIPEHMSDKKIGSAKLEMLIAQLFEAISNQHKILVFVNYLAAIESIGAALDQAEVPFVSMSGQTKNRQALVDRFQTDPDCKVFIMTLKTGGTGLNLTAADTIFIFDPWWNVAAENQAIDRAHRIGQTNKVMAYKLIVEGTIEEKILELQQVKKALFDQVITPDGKGLKSLSEEDINFILS